MLCNGPDDDVLTEFQRQSVAEATLGLAQRRVTATTQRLRKARVSCLTNLGKYSFNLGNEKTNS